jgi:hypothetical protein
VSRFDDFFRTYYRRFNLNKSGDKQQQPTQQQFQDYHETLIKDAKSYHYHKEKLNSSSNLSLAARNASNTGFGKVLTLIFG